MKNSEPLFVRVFTNVSYILLAFSLIVTIGAYGIYFERLFDEKSDKTMSHSISVGDNVWGMPPPPPKPETKELNRWGKIIYDLFS